MKSTIKYYLKSKKIPIDEFIANALYDKNYGYYSKKIPFGKRGDFVTAPEISFLYSEILALWIVSLWEHLNKPKTFNVVELGPGSGQMNSTLIKVFKKFPNFFKSTNIFLYEKSKILTQLQKKNLFGEKIRWVKNFKSIKSGPVIFLGNEFFDAIPIKQYKKINNILYEKYVKLDDNSKITSFLKKAKLKTIKELKKFDLLKNYSSIEFPKQGLEELDLITKTIKRLKGGLLLIDYGFLKQMSHFGVDVASLDVVNMKPPEGSTAFAQGKVDMFCGWGGSLRSAKEYGNVLLTGDEKTALGILVWDVTSSPASFATENEEIVAKFLSVTAAANAMWNSGDHHELMIPHIAIDSGMDAAAVASDMSTFLFPSVGSQLSDAWLGGTGQTFLKAVADIFVDAEEIEEALDSYDNAVNTDALNAVADQIIYSYMSK